MKPACIFLCFAFGVIISPTQDLHAEVPVTEAPAVGDMDLQKFIDDQVAAGKREVIIPPGRYRVVPRKGVHLRLTGLQDVKIIADGVEMICTETTRAIEVQKCRNVLLRGLTVDYDPLPYTQGRITALAPDKKWIEFEIFQGYPEKPGAHLEIFDGKSETLKTSTHYGWNSLENLGGRRYRISKGSSYSFDAKKDFEEVGDIVIADSSDAPGGQIPHAIVSSECVDLVLENVTVFASNCFTFFEMNCDRTTYLRCSLKPCPMEQDLRKRGHRRIRSGNADAFHSKHAKRGPQIIGCTAKFQGDDCVNICGDYYMVAASDGEKVRVLLYRPLNIATGDKVELVTYAGERLPDATVIAIEPGGEPQEPERAFISSQRMDRNIQSQLIAKGAKAVVVTLDRKVELPIGSVIASTERMGNGFVVKDCDFGFNRSRGILIKASQGKITGNKITSCWGQGILVAPEWWWLESGSSNDLEIARNTITGCASTAITVTARGGNGAIAPAGAHNRISIVENKIDRCSLPCIFVSSTRGLEMDRNELPPGTGAIRLENCQEVKGEGISSKQVK